MRVRSLLVSCVVSGAVGLSACGGASDAGTSGTDPVATISSGSDETPTTSASSDTPPSADSATPSTGAEEPWPVEIEDPVRACTALLRDGTATILEFRATADPTDIDAISLACGPATDELIQFGGDTAIEVATELTRAGDDFYDEVEDPGADVDDWAARADAIDALIP